MRTSAKGNRYLLSTLILGLVIAFSPNLLMAKDKICKHPPVQDKASLTQWRWGGVGNVQEEEQKKEKEYPKLEGKEECYNYRRSGKKINCACSHTCDLNKGDPNNRYIIPGAEDYKCSNHCKKQMCKCKTKCQT